MINLSRNYENEKVWRKYHYSRYHLALTKDYGEKFDYILKKNNLSFTDFMKSMIDYFYNSYMNEEKGNKEAEN